MAVSRKRRGLRIIGGEWRRRRVPVPGDGRVRPTPDRVRETLFNWLAGWRLSSACCLDLYAGSGALGLEALSRGAAHAVFVEHDPELAAMLRKFCTELGAPAEVLRANASQFLQEAGTASFDLVFLDPPYDQPVAEDLAQLARLIKEDGLIYVERPVDQGLPNVESLTWWRQARAGAVSFGLARRTDLG